jgi:hypothetical protein
MPLMLLAILDHASHLHVRVGIQSDRSRYLCACTTAMRRAACHWQYRGNDSKHSTAGILASFQSRSDANGEALPGASCERSRFDDMRITGPGCGHEPSPMMAVLGVHWCEILQPSCVPALLPGTAIRKSEGRVWGGPDAGLQRT